MKIITTALAPNIEPDDITLASHILCHPNKWRTGQAVTRLEEMFTRELGTPAFAVSSGRTGLLGILKVLGIGTGAEVCIQAYTCVAVPAPIMWSGAIPVYVDIDPTTFTMDPDDLEKKITPKTKAIIVQHTFGLPADIARIGSIARAHNIFLIEDCAHAIRSQWDEKMVGTFGDAAFFSFGRDKVISGTFGGMVAFRDEHYAQAFKKWRDALAYPSSVWIVRQLMQPKLLSFARDHLHWGVLAKVFMQLIRLTGLTARAVEPQERFGKKPKHVPTQLPEALGRLALHQYKKLDRFLEHRREIAQIYDRFLRESACIRPHTSPRVVHTYLRYTIQTSRAEALRSYAKSHGVILGDWYTTPIAPDDVNEIAISYTPGSCPQAEKIAKESVNLPTSPVISIVDARRVGELVRDFLKKYENKEAR